MFASDNVNMGKFKSSHSGKERRASTEKGDEWFTDLDFLGIEDMPSDTRY
jgi:hypothetical protein